MKRESSRAGQVFPKRRQIFKGVQCTVDNSRLLSTKHPDLFQQLSHNQPTGIDIPTLTYGSSQKVNWVCLLCQNAYSMSVQLRTKKGPGCPRCKFNSKKLLRNAFPEIYSQLAPQQADGVEVQFLKYGSQQKVNFICDRYCGKVYSMAIANRTSQKQGCPDCKYGPPKMLKNEYPDIYAQLVVKDDTLTIGQHRMCEFRCSDCDFIYESTINKRISNKKNAVNPRDCPRCHFRIINDTNNILALYPQMLDYLAGNANGNIFNLQTLSPRSRERAHFACKTCLYEWNSTISECTKKIDRGISICAGCARKRRTPLLNLQIEHPAIAERLHPEKNSKLAKELTSSSSKRTWWYFSECTHEFEARITDMVKGGGKCMTCRHQLELLSATAFRSCIEEQHTEVSSMHNLQRCAPAVVEFLSESDRQQAHLIDPHSDQVYCFQCSQKHQWQAKMFQVVAGKRCLVCRKKKHRNIPRTSKHEQSLIIYMSQLLQIAPVELTNTFVANAEHVSMCNKRWGRGFAATNIRPDLWISPSLNLSTTNIFFDYDCASVHQTATSRDSCKSDILSHNGVNVVIRLRPPPLDFIYTTDMRIGTWNEINLLSRLSWLRLCLDMLEHVERHFPGALFPETLERARMKYQEESTLSQTEKK